MTTKDKRLTIEETAKQLLSKGFQVAQIRYDSFTRNEIDLNVIGIDRNGNYMEQALMASNGTYSQDEVTNVCNGYHKYAGMSFAGRIWAPNALPDDKGD